MAVCNALYLTTAQATTEIGTVIARRTAGSVVITINTALGGYTVNTWCGADQVDGWCAGYTTLAEARAAANHTRDAFKLWSSLEGINRRRQQLIADRDQTERRYDRTRSNDTRAAYRGMLADIDTKLAQLDDLWTRTQITSRAA